MIEHRYAVERLYRDQHPDLVADTVAPLLVWLEQGTRGGRLAAAGFLLRTHIGGVSTDESLELAWSLSELESFTPGTTERIRRLKTLKGPEREHITELAAYALAMVLLSTRFPGRRAVAFRCYAPPDILIDDTPGALVGVEVAGRSTGGWNALRLVLEGSPTKFGKRAALAERKDIAEAHVSLWCCSPPVSMWVQVKP